MSNVLFFPIKPKIEGEGRITYRCAACHEPIPDGRPVFVPPLPLTPETRTYHAEHLETPNGR